MDKAKFADEQNAFCFSATLDKNLFTAIVKNYKPYSYLTRNNFWYYPKINKMVPVLTFVKTRKNVYSLCFCMPAEQAEIFKRPFNLMLINEHECYIEVKKSIKKDVLEFMKDMGAIRIWKENNVVWYDLHSVDGNIKWKQYSVNLSHFHFKGK